MAKLIHVVLDKLIIKYKQQRIATTGSTGTKGVRNPRFKSGCVFRKISTAQQTNVKAVNVPMFTKFANTCRSKSPANKAATTPVIHVFNKGIFTLLFTRANAFEVNRRGSSHMKRELVHT